MQGVLLVDKPKEWTSFDVVNYVRRQVAVAEGKKPKNTKVGHTGTLDPLATGLLVVLVGKEYTRRATELTKLGKTYDVTMKLGETSSTGDAEGMLTKYHHLERREEPGSFADAQDNIIPKHEDVEAALQKFTGEIMQTPPVFSAMKINGQRAYKLAREGKEVVLEARPVTIYSNTLTSYNYPFVHFTSEVGSGTYVRSLVEDLGKELKTGAYMSDLRRTRVGKFDLKDACDIKDSNLLEQIKTLP